MSQLGHYQLGYTETLSHWNQRALQLPLIFIVMCFKYVRIGKAKLFVIMKWRITLWGYN